MFTEGGLSNKRKKGGETCFFGKETERGKKRGDTQGHSLTPKSNGKQAWSHKGKKTANPAKGKKPLAPQEGKERIVKKKENVQGPAHSFGGEKSRA